MRNTHSVNMKNKTSINVKNKKATIAQYSLVYHQNLKISSRVRRFFYLDK
jgi:hypothetical protein